MLTKDIKTFLRYVQYFTAKHFKRRRELWYFLFPLRTKECMEQREAFLILCIWRFLYNIHWRRHFDVFWNIPDLIHLLILLIRCFPELLKWLKCRVDKGFGWVRFRTLDTCLGAFRFVSQHGSTCFLEDLSASSSVTAAAVFVCLYTRGCHWEGLAGIVYAVCGFWSCPSPRDHRSREDKRRNFTLQSTRSYSSACSLGVQKHIK